MKTQSYAAYSADTPLEQYEFERREPTDYDVEIRLKYCGVCHSDIHTARGDWGEADYPCVPGHEMIGEVSRVGTKVSQHKTGDVVGVGVVVNSCGDCTACKADYEQYCENDFTETYGSKDPIDGETTKGGYSSLIVVQEKFVIPVPKELDITKAAPLFCAGITMYSPLAHWQAGPGKKVAILGLGGLGHMGVKFAHAMGAEVWVVTSSPEKAADAKKYGADGVIISSNSDEIAAARRQFDLIIDTIPVEHDLSPYLEMLAINGTICLVGPINPMPGYHGGQVIGGRKSIAGSGIGSVAEIKEMLAFCAEHNILPDTEMVTMDQINDVWETLLSKGLSHRHVIDLEASFSESS